MLARLFNTTHILCPSVVFELSQTHSEYLCFWIKMHCLSSLRKLSMWHAVRLSVGESFFFSATVARYNVTLCKCTRIYKAILLYYFLFLWKCIRRIYELFIQQGWHYLGCRSRNMSTYVLRYMRNYKNNYNWILYTNMSIRGIMHVCDKRYYESFVEMMELW